jgi:hypothetical protein
MNLVLRNRPEQSYSQKNRNGACSGLDRLNKKAFLSMIGAEKYTPPNGLVFRDEEKLEELKKVLEENNSNVMLAAASLGIAPSVFRKRYNALSAVVSLATSVKEPASPTPQRRFFENILKPWSITSFDPKKKEVCVDIQAGPITSHVSANIP